MNGDHLAHLDRITKRLTADLAQKYRRGQAEHGGRLWNKAGMLARTDEELLDLITYVYTMREQLETVYDLLKRGEHVLAKDGLRAVLDGDPKD